MDDEDGDFVINTSSRSRLSSIFQEEGGRSNVNEALTFTAPKQPKKNVSESSNQPAGAFVLLHAAVVHAYKLIDGNYVIQGKLGCAILGNHESSKYKMLMYKGKQVHVTSCVIASDFTFQVQPNNYANFYDDNKENWSVNFESQSALIDFAKQVALAKMSSQGKSKRSSVIQELFSPGVGPALNAGGCADVRYTGWVLRDHGFGEVFESNMQDEHPLQVWLEESRTIQGWCECLLGAEKHSRRLLLLPADEGTREGFPSVPSNTAAAFEILVVEVASSEAQKHEQKHEELVENVQGKSAKETPLPNPEDNVRLRGASISEQLSQSPRKDKADLMSRISRVGTATLPPLVSGESRNNPPVAPSRPSILPPTSAAEVDTLTPLPLCEEGAANVPHTDMAAGSRVHFPSVKEKSSVEDPSVISQLTQKMDYLMQAVEQLRKEKNHSVCECSEGSALLRGVERIVQENKSLKRTIQDKNATIEMLNKKFGQTKYSEDTSGVSSWARDGLVGSHQSMELNKLKDFSEAETALKKRIEDLEVELESSAVWKKKYETLYEKTLALKRSYERRIEELLTEKKDLQASLLSDSPAKIFPTFPDNTQEVD